MMTAIVEATLQKGGERIALGIMSAAQALALPYDEIEFSHPFPGNDSDAAESGPTFFGREEFARLLEHVPLRS